ncbi:MAG: 2-iminoacetate synthase ThiH, partial [Verrucomicrobiae bacterium]|nr:2-iminoacetate synthase ThiH [Verrucomicrobiae bacterium]
MPFSEVFRDGAWRNWPGVRRVAGLLQPLGAEQLEALAAESQARTLQNFGRTIRLFAPLYLSNECVNICKYCGFSRDNPILRLTLAPEQVAQEAGHLIRQGFRNLLLVAGEHPKFVSENYLQECVTRLRPLVPSIHLELGPMETSQYAPLTAAGAEGLVVYQETYDRDVYAEMHVAGPKKDFDGRLDCAERGYAAGFRRLGVGALLGLADWRTEALALAAHLEHLLRVCWKA